MTKSTGNMLIAGAVLWLAAAVYAVPISVLDDPNWEHRNDKKEQSVQLITSQEEAEVTNYNSGDIANYLCDKGIITNGTFGGTGCWGYRAPDGTEYALYGVATGIAVVNTATMTQVGIAPGPQGGCGTTLWREMRVYSHYAYATSECTGTNSGLLVIDLGNLPASISVVGAFAVDGATLRTSHSLSIDTTNGYAYLEGTNTANQSIRIHSLANPASPVYINSFGISGGIHDCTALDDTLWVAEGFNPSFSVYNMANKMSPALITRVTIPASGYVHNIWPSEDRHYLASTEETANKTLKVWDISNLASITLIGEIMGPSHLTHNAYWKGNRIYTSHYESGFVIFDVSDPTQPQLELQYDTYPTENPDFNGAWGGYPYTNNNTMYASNLDGKLYVIEERTDTLFDTLWADTSVTQAGNQVEVTIYAANSHPIHKFQIPLSWVGPANMSFNSTSRTGTRTDYFQSETYPAFDFANSRMVINLTASNNNTAPDLPAGSGPIIKVIYDVPAEAPIAINPITFATYVSANTYTPSFSSKCINVLADTLSGAVSVASCCVGLRGDANNTGGNPTITDLTFMVSFLFNGGASPVCFDEANINGLGSITVTDLTYLVSYLFNGGPAPAACP